MFNTFPCTLTHEGRKVPIKEVKWQSEATTDQNTIDNWKNLYGHKIKLWGIPTGSSNGLLVLDVDVKNNGLETIKNYHVPLTLSQRTMSGGMHYIYRYPNDGQVYGNKVNFDNGLDIRGEGGYICYYGFDNTLIADAPQWLLDQALTTKKKEIDLTQVTGVSYEITQAIVKEACDNICNAPEGESNNILNIESYRVGQLVGSNSLDYEMAYNELFKAAKERGKPDYEAKATITSGLSGGGKNPITSPFGNSAPILTIPLVESQEVERWTPRFFTKYDLTNFSKLRKPQLFKDWSTEDIHITTADGGTGKTTLKLVESICLALGQPFLGFECLKPGRTLFITGEDTAEKIAAMLGAILKQMKILDDDEKVKIIMDSIIVKKDSELCLIDKAKGTGFITLNQDALTKVSQAVDDLKPRMIVFDPISSFWGSETALNDMAKAVIKFIGKLVEKSDACVEIINHMGKLSSTSKDMSQFAGRGGTGLPSHARVSRVLRAINDEEYEEATGLTLEDGKNAMMCQVNKFSDGSPLWNKPFIIVRDGYLFERVVLVEQKVKEELNKMSDKERIFNFVKEERENQRYPNKDIIIAEFMASSEKISKDRVTRALTALAYNGHLGEKLKLIDNPDIEMGGKVYIVIDEKGVEI